MSAGFNYIGWDPNMSKVKKPDWLPKILCCASRDDEKSSVCLKRVYIETKLLPDSGYIFGFMPKFVQRRLVSPQAKANMRRKRLRKQVEENYPLFADEMEKRTVEENPEKFSAESIAQVQSELRQMEKHDISEFSNAMSPKEALDFLRKTVVVPFCSQWIDEMHRQRQSIFGLGRRA